MKEIVGKFAENVVKNLRDLVKAIAIFGSVAREEQTEKSDIDVLIIIDDTLIPWTAQTYSIVFEKIGEAMKDIEGKEKIHANVITLTRLFQNLFAGDPVTINILKEGIPIYDTGIFITLRRLVLGGVIAPSEFSAKTTFARAMAAEGRVKWKLLTCLLDIYWAMMLAAEALLLKNGILPGNPKKVLNQIRSFLEEKYVKWLEEIYEIQKKILRYEKTEAKIEEIKEWMERCKEFIDRISSLL